MSRGNGRCQTRQGKSETTEDDEVGGLHVAATEQGSRRTINDNDLVDITVRSEVRPQRWPAGRPVVARGRAGSATLPAMASPIPHNWQVPKIFRDRMGAHAGRQRCMAAEGHLLLVVHEMPDPRKPGTREGQLHWREPSGAWHCSAGGPPTIVPLRSHVEAYAEAAARHEALAEKATSADDWYALVYATGPVARTTKNLAAALQEAREAAKDDHELITVRDASSDVARSFELLHAHAREGLEYTTAKRAEEQSRNAEHMLVSAHRLNLTAALFLPMTAIATIFGMNLDHGLAGIAVPAMFWAVVGAALLLGLIVRASLPRPPAPVPHAPPKPAATKPKHRP